MSFAWLNELSIKQLKAAAHDVCVDIDGICEKAELAAAVRASPKRGKLVKKNVLAPGYAERMLAKTEKRQRLNNLRRLTRLKAYLRVRQEEVFE